MLLSDVWPVTCLSPMAPIVYLLVLFCLSVSLVVLVTFRRQSDRLTEVIRTLALRNAESMDTGNTP